MMSFSKGRTASTWSYRQTLPLRMPANWLPHFGRRSKHRQARLAALLNHQRFKRDEFAQTPGRRLRSAPLC